MASGLCDTRWWKVISSQPRPYLWQVVGTGSGMWKSCFSKWWAIYSPKVGFDAWTRGQDFLIESGYLFYLAGKLLALPEDSKWNMSFAVRNGICRYCCLTEGCGRILPPGVTCRKKLIFSSCQAFPEEGRGKTLHVSRHKIKAHFSSKQRSTHNAGEIYAAGMQFLRHHAKLSLIASRQVGSSTGRSVARHVHMYGRAHSAAEHRCAAMRL